MNMPAWWANRVRYDKPALLSIHMCADCGALLMPKVSQPERPEVPGHERAFLWWLGTMLGSCPECYAAAAELARYLSGQPRA